jgi:hypothetical protein
MDIHEDISRTETAIRTIRTFGDLNRDSETDGEEFIGFNNIASSDSDTDSHTEDPVNLKVRYLYQFRSKKHSPHLTEDKQSSSRKDQGPPSKG